MRVAAVADLHGNLPEIPKCDLLILAGDCIQRDPGPRDPEARLSYATFERWLYSQPAETIVGIFGNHDGVELEVARAFPWTFLHDETVVIDGLKIHGSPWTPEFCGWSWMREDPDLEERWALIPEDVDVLVTHGPPRGICDRTAEFVNAGSETLLSRLAAIDGGRAFVHVFGHIHEGFGRVGWRAARFYNVSYVDEHYRPVNGVTVFDI